MDARISSEEKLATRSRYLLKRSAVARHNPHISALLDEFTRIGRVALIGGAIRELRYRSSRKFCSDLDFVIEVRDATAFGRLVASRGAEKNNFGGYRIRAGNTDIDFWSASESWAHTSGHVDVAALEDVVNTTFFNVDAVLYLLGEDRIFAKPGTLRALDDRYLDINLHPNPNPIGSAVRAIRRLLQHEMRASPALTAYIAEKIDMVGWSRLVEVDCSAYPTRRVLASHPLPPPKSGAEFASMLARHRGQIPQGEQLSLF